MLTAVPGAQAVYLPADLASLTQTRALAQRIQTLLDARGGRLDALCCNAGAIAGRYTPTVDGLELQFAVNHLSGFVLCARLWPYLQAARGRVVVTSSASHRHARLPWRNIMLRGCYNVLLAYKNTKMMNVLFVGALNRRNAGVRAYALDPGLVNTRIGGKGGPLTRWFWRLCAAHGQPPDVPASTMRLLALGDLGGDAAQPYWYNEQPLRPDPYALSPANMDKLWAISRALSGENF